MLLIHMSRPPSATPSTVPKRDHSGLTLRTGFRSAAIGAVAHGVLVGGQLVVRAAGAERRERGLGGQHAGLHRVVAALDARHVDEAGRAADQRAAREGQLRHRLPAALGDRARAVGDALAALEKSARSTGCVLKRWNSSNGERYGFL